MTKKEWRYAATTALGEIGSATEPALKSLQAATKDGDEGLQIAARLALWQLKKDAGQIVPLIEHLISGETMFRGRAADALGRIGPAAKTAVPALKEAARGKDVYLAIAANLALWKIDRVPESIPALTKILKEQRGDGRWLQAMEMANRRANALSALGEVGPAAKSALPMLLDSLSDNIRWVRKEAAKALEKIAPKVNQR
jgi:HEAT repeat protein